jgi:hypothetical protein
MRFIFKSLLLALAVTAVVKFYPDFERYMKMRAM